jgi:putative ABC transport system permease protein
MIHDLRTAARRLRLSPAFTVSAIFTLALGISATTLMFSVVETVLLRPLPFPDPNRLVVLSDVLNHTDLTAGEEAGVTAPDVRDYVHYTRSLEHLGAYLVASYELSGVSDPIRVNAARMTAAVFPALGVPPMIGRVFSQQEEDENQQVVVLSCAAWRKYFQGDMNVVGQSLRLNRKPYIIIGVMPVKFQFPLLAGHGEDVELWVPMSFSPEDFQGENMAAWGFRMVGRLAPGVTLADAQNDSQRIAELITKNYPPFMNSVHISALVQPLQEATVAQARSLLRTLFLAVLFVLLIACVNLAGLLLVRAMGRRRETGIRLALGARAATILGRALLESIILSMTSGLLGLILAAMGLQIGKTFLPDTIPRISEIGLDWKIAFFAASLAALAGISCGVAPAFAAIRVNVNDALKEGGRGETPGGRHARLRSVLVITEIAIAFVLVSSSGLLLLSFEKMRAVRLGFRPDHVLAASYSLPREQYSTQPSVDEFNNELMRRLETLPGVRSAGITSMLPASGADVLSNFVVEDHATPKGTDSDLAWSSSVSGDYFHVLGIELLRGRFFSEADRANTQLVLIANRKLAETYWPKQDPIGKRIRWGMPETPTPWMTVVGEVDDIKQGRRDQDTREQTYQPSTQQAASLGTFASNKGLNATHGMIVVRTSIPPGQIRRAVVSTVHSIDPQLPLTNMQALDRVISESDASRSFFTGLIIIFAAASSLLVFSGVYSVIAVSTAQRQQEMAIRLALGSQRSRIRRIILLSGAKLALSGCVIGVGGTLIASRLLRAFLFELSPFDPSISVAALIFLLLLTLAASLLPAWRVASIDPAKALHAG